jgi:hypothetical protein
MPYTLAEAEKYSTEDVVAGVVETIIDESPMLNYLEFEEFLGNALAYNRETTLPTVAFFDPGDTWTESTPVVTRVTSKLKILGGDADVDKFLQLTRSRDNNLEGVTVAQKSKAIAREWQDEVVYGSVAIDPKGFDGLHVLMPAAQSINISVDATPDPGTFSKLEELIDVVRPGKPDLLIVSRRTRRAMQAGARSLGTGHPLQTVQLGPAEFGRFIDVYNGIPIEVNDFITDVELLTAGGLFSAKTGGTASTIFAIKTGVDNGGFIGLEPSGQPGIQVEDVGTLETKDAARKRVKWYTTVALLGTKAIGRLTGLSGANWTN